MRPTTDRLEEQVVEKAEKSYEQGGPATTANLEDSDVETQKEMMSHDNNEKDAPGCAEAARPSDHAIKESDPESDETLMFWEPKPPKVLMNDPNESPLELRSQIQLYAMNEWVHA